MNGNTNLLPLTEMMEDIRDWFSSDLGEQLLTAEQEVLDKLVGGVFGYHLLQIGLVPRLQLLRQSSASHKFEMLPSVNLGMSEAGVVGNASELPFASECIDAVMLHHALDFAQSPHQVLREAARVLRPGGKLVVVGFNPASFWGAYKQISSRNKDIPWCSHFIRQRRLHDWLTLLELKQETTVSGFYRPPFKSQKWMRKLEFMERWGAAYRVANGAFFVVIATKESVTLTPVGMNWRRRLVFPLIHKPLQQAGRKSSGEIKSVLDTPEIDD
ncbi:methyltransferase domain-containing protein [Motiliproteus sp. MSK22-1]|uniref:methyltransferase domain-containing protein n=1 Tax=Motiliproteus sp. MSK22-1 TaxID=1897630 RepID=UPI00130169A0|nr:methyltransferase domain-containing protein [Motiliproteus sp. MSK22-1]